MYVFLHVWCGVAASSHQRGPDRTHTWLVQTVTREGCFTRMYYSPRSQQSPERAAWHDVHLACRAGMVAATTGGSLAWCDPPACEQVVASSPPERAVWQWLHTPPVEQVLQWGSQQPTGEGRLACMYSSMVRCYSSHQEGCLM
jgi:hypothetical protein